MRGLHKISALTLRVLLLAGICLGLLPIAGYAAPLPPDRVMTQPRGMSQETYQLNFPVAHRNHNGWNTTLVLRNMGESMANVVLDFYWDSGGTAGQHTLTLPPSGTEYLFLGDVYAVSNGRYAVIVSSDQPLTGLAWENTQNTSTDIYQGIPNEAVDTSVYLPAVNNTTPSQIYIQNISTTNAANINMDFYDTYGTSCSYTGWAEAESTWNLDLSTVGCLPSGFSGSAVVSADQPVAVAVYEVNTSQNYPLKSYTGFAAAQSATSHYAPSLLDNVYGWVSALTVQNVGTTEAQITVTYSDGAPQDSALVPPGSAYTFDYNTGQHTQGPFDATITADQPIVALVDKTQINSGSAGTIHKTSTESTTDHTLPIALSAYQSFNTAVLMINPGANYADVTYTYVNLDGTTLSSHNAPIAPGESLSKQPSMDGVPSSWQGSVTVMADHPLFVLGGTSNSSMADGNAVFLSYTPARPAVSLVKQVTPTAVTIGQPVTFTLDFDIGEETSAVITDILPSELVGYSFEASPGISLTLAGGSDYVWQILSAPTGSGVITVSGVITGVMEDTMLTNMASLSAATGDAQASADLIVDLTAPTTSLTETPPDPDNNATPTFRFFGDDGAGSGISHFLCRVDGGAWANCSSPHTLSELGDDPHTFEVYALDNAGLMDTTPASYTWTIDLTPPAVPTLSGPADASTITDRQSVTLTWQAVGDADLAGYKVNLGGQVYDAGNVTGYATELLANGTYTWSVASYDALGNISAYATPWAFTLDADAPVLQSFSPDRNHFTAAPDPAVSLTYDQNMDPATVSAQTFAVHGTQSGRVMQAFDTNGAIITLTPDTSFYPGELVRVSASSGLRNAAGLAEVPGTVWQFCTAVGTGNGLGSGVFSDTLPGFGTLGYSLAMGDVDGDSDLDAMVARWDSTEVYLNDNGTFSSGQVIPMGAQGVALGDLDGDGDLDAFLGVIDSNSGHQIWFNNGGKQGGTPGVFSDSGQVLGWQYVSQVVLGDLDNDGDLDAYVSAYSDSDGDQTWRNDGSGYFVQWQIVGGDYNRTGRSVDLGDLDGDGDLDAFVGRGGSQPANEVWFNDGTGILVKSAQALGNQQSFGVKLGDLDGDGDLDAFAANYANAYTTDASNKVWLNDGIGNFTDSEQALGDNSGYNLSLGDLDGDGDLDAFVVNSQNAYPTPETDEVWFNDGAATFIAGTQSLNTISYDVHLGDLDGDGDLDAFLLDITTTTNRVLLNMEATAVAVDDVTLAGPATGETLTPYSFMATVSPQDATLPIAYTWTATDQEAVTVSANAINNTMTFAWDTAGVKIVNVSASNTAGTAQTVYTVTLTEKTFPITPTETVSDTFVGSGGMTTTVTVPAGAVSATGEVKLDFTPVETGTLPAPPSGGSVMGFSLDLLLDGTVQEGFVFEQPITLFIAYDEAVVSSPALLELYYLDSQGQWSNDGITIIEPIGNPLEVTIAHLTTFALVEAEPAPELNVQKTIDTGGFAAVPLGNVVTYTIAISNTGTEIANAVVLTDPLPSGLAFGAWVDYGGSAILPPPGTVILPPVITWSPGDLPVGAKLTLSFTAIVTDNTDFAGDTILNTAYVSADNHASVSDAIPFTITSAAGNTPPTISNIADQTTTVSKPITVTFSISDTETPAASLTLSATSSNPALLPMANITFDGSGTARSAMLTPVAEITGTATITITVSDGELTASDRFMLTVEQQRIYLPLVMRN